MISLSNTWKQYFWELETNSNVNKNLEVCFSVTDAEKNGFEDNFIESTKEAKGAIDITIAPVTKKITLYHSFINLGGARLRPANKSIALSGFGLDAIGMSFNTSSFLDIIDLKTLSYTTLSLISDSKVIEKREEQGLSKF